jgi:hypothetical protein
LYIWEKYRTFEITSGIILKMNLPLYKGSTLEITNKWWPLTTLNRWPLYRIKIYSKMYRESTKVTVMSRWPLYKGDRYDRFDNISAAPAYGVYISQMIRYSRVCGSYKNSLDRGLLLTRKVLNQGFLLVKLKSSLWKRYGLHHDLVDRYGISVSQMTTDMFRLS